VRLSVLLPTLLSGCLLPTTVYIGRELPSQPSDVDPPSPVDKDRDGVTVEEGDCDDGDRTVGPGFHEYCDGRDNDCDGAADSGGACAVDDRFAQEMKTDVLVVFDNSFDMMAYLGLADAGARALTEHLVGENSDTRIGVLFNDLANDRYSGRLVSPPGAAQPWIEGNDPRLTVDRVRRFFDETILYAQPEPTDGNQGIRAAVEKAMGLDGGEGSPFFRPDASLNLVIVTNHDDDSNPDDTKFLHDLVTAKGSLSQITVYAVTQLSDADCQTPSVGNPPADSIISLVQQTGGMYESVCMDDWTGFLSSGGQAIADQALRTTFTLQAPAQLDSLSVSIVPDDGSESYLWDSFALSDPYTLVFTSAPPPIGTTIVVDYRRDWQY